MTWPFSDLESPPLPPTLPDGSAWPRISVVTPSFGQGAYIEETILSVLNQGYPNVEHLVMDGGSTDDTVAILDKYRDRLTCAVSEKDNGQSDAINKGMRRATGEIVTWLNSDDRFAPGALAGAALAFHTSKADLVAGVCELWKDGTLVDEHLTSCADGALPLHDLLDLDGCWNAGQFFYQPEVLFTRALWERAGGYVDETALYSMDYELWLRFAEQGARLKVIGRPIAQFRMHDAQKTANPELFRAELPTVRDRFLAQRHRVYQPRPAKPLPKARLRAVFFNDIGFKHGAGIGHERLAQAMAIAGHEIVAVAANSDGASGRVPPSTAANLLSKIGAGEPDLVVLGNLHAAALEPSLLGLIADRWPTALVLHDLWALTGRCAYTQGCPRYLDGCDEKCPTPTEYPQLAPDRIAAAWKTKRRILTGRRPPALLANSRWSHGLAAGVFADKARVHLQAPPIDWVKLPVPDAFHPRDKRASRDLLGLPEKGFLIMFSATAILDPRKGRDHLVSALTQLDLPDAELVCVGFGNDGMTQIGPHRVRALGFVTDVDRMASLYSAVDVFVGPSLEESFGQVFVEAAACGTPSVGYPVGGVPEAIVDGITGSLAASVSSESLAAAIKGLHDDPVRREAMGRWGRMLVENEWSYAAAYHRLYSALVTTGLRDTLGLSRKISLVPAALRRPLGATTFGDPTNPCWRALSGFGPWEGPFPQWGLGLCRWQEGPVGRLELFSESLGRHTLFLKLRNFEPGQRFRIVHQGVVAHEGELSVSGDPPDFVITCELDVQATRSTLELHAWRWKQGVGERAMAVLVVGMTLVPAPSQGSTPPPIPDPC